MTRMTGPDCVVMCNLINTYIHTNIHIYIHAYIHTYTHTYIDIHTYIHTYIHICLFKVREQLCMAPHYAYCRRVPESIAIKDHEPKEHCSDHPSRLSRGDRDGRERGAESPGRRKAKGRQVLAMEKRRMVAAETRRLREQQQRTTAQVHRTTKINE